MPTKDYVNIRPNNYNESPKSKHAKLKATHDRAANIKTSGKKTMYRKHLSNTKANNKQGWKKGFKVLFYL